MKINVKSILKEKAEVAMKKAGNMYIKEKPGEKVSYEWDEVNRRILKINIMER